MSALGGRTSPGPALQGQDTGTGTGASLWVAAAGMGAALSYKVTLLAIIVGETRQDSGQDP